jgi:hypothetical protein
MTAPPPRPRAVTAAFWCWVVASILLIIGGLIAASVGLPPVYRGAGVLTAIGGAAMAFLAGRTRSGDPRFRRAAVALFAVFGVVHMLTLVAVIPLIAGTVLIGRPSTETSGGKEQP